MGVLRAEVKNGDMLMSCGVFRHWTFFISFSILAYTINMKIIKALSFDDVLLLPCKSSVLPKDTDVSTRLTRRIRLQIPIISAAMDTVTESALASSIANLVGIGIIHKNMSALCYSVHSGRDNW